jgi:hypothetical protein
MAGHALVGIVAGALILLAMGGVRKLWPARTAAQ